MVTITTAIAAAGAWFGGAIAHELTHYTVARVFGQDASVDVLQLDVWFETEGLAGWKRRTIMLAPQAVGVTALVGALVAGVGPSIGLLPLLVGWVSFTLMGGPADLSIRVSDGAPATQVAASMLGLGEVPQEKRDAILLLLAGMNVMLVGGVLTAAVSDGSGELASVVYHLGGPFVIAVGMGLLLAGGLRQENQGSEAV